MHFPARFLWSLCFGCFPQVACYVFGELSEALRSEGETALTNEETNRLKAEVNLLGCCACRNIILPSSLVCGWNELDQCLIVAFSIDFAFEVACAYRIFLLCQRVLELALHAETFATFCYLCLLLVCLQNVGCPLFVIRKEHWDCIMSSRWL